ncbi:MAG: DUF2794 domain-containing protein [Hyphomicrobiales bacterium]|nr:DUF2794 domain-containing protein [Hyphomicrobiales bacterium]
MTDARLSGERSNGSVIAFSLHGADISASPFVSFGRAELGAIFKVYGRKVAEGEWRDYAIDMLREKAVFSVFRRTAECALYRIEKTPKLSRKQGMYSVVAASGLVMRRGHDLQRVLRVLEKQANVLAL